jgi:hypothetical protein
MVPVPRTYWPFATSASPKSSKALIRNIFSARCGRLVQLRSLDAVTGAVDGFAW